MTPRDRPAGCSWSATSERGTKSMLAESIFCTSPLQTTLFDLNGKLQVNYKSPNPPSNSSASALDAGTALLPGNAQPRKTSALVPGQNGTPGLIVSYGGPGKGSIACWTFAKVSSRLAARAKTPKVDAVAWCLKRRELSSKTTCLRFSAAWRSLRTASF